MDGSPTSPRYRPIAEANEIADTMVSRCQDEHRSFVFLNLAVIDGPKSKVSFAMALSEAQEPNTIVVFRQQPPVAGTTSQVYLPPGTTPRRPGRCTNQYR
jgi:hypothetical protein